VDEGRHQRGHGHPDARSHGRDLSAGAGLGAARDPRGPVLILGLLVVILTLASPYFFTGDNLSNVLVQVAPLACLAIGQLFVILVGGIDLSVGSVLALCTVTGALAYG
jgi:ribose transport system permease protein